jgi:hypothetical protein
MLVGFAWQNLTRCHLNPHGVTMFGPIRTLCFAAALYLTLTLFVWFAFSGAMVTPVLWLHKFILLHWMPDIFVDVQRGTDVKYLFDVFFLLVHDEAAAARAAAGEGIYFTMNPMIYGYGIPVIAGLALATPNTAKNRIKQIVLGTLVIWLVQTNGSVWESLQYLMNNQQNGPQALAVHGITPTLLALMYQFGYLILPPLTPVIFWALMNRQFIDDLIKLDHIQSLDDFPVNDATNEQKL